MDPGNFLQHVHVDDDLFSLSFSVSPSGDDRLVRDTVHNLRQKFFVKKVDLLTKIGDTIKALGQKEERTKLVVLTHHVDSVH